VYAQKSVALAPVSYFFKLQYCCYTLYRGIVATFQYYCSVYQLALFQGVKLNVASYFHVTRSRVCHVIVTDYIGVFPIAKNILTKFRKKKFDQRVQKLKWMSTRTQTEWSFYCLTK
jgi:hypothetical protein